jgi:hypothetical protein
MADRQNSTVDVHKYGSYNISAGTGLSRESSERINVDSMRHRQAQNNPILLDGNVAREMQRGGTAVYRLA